MNTERWLYLALFLSLAFILLMATVVAVRSISRSRAKYQQFLQSIWLSLNNMQFGERQRNEVLLSSVDYTGLVSPHFLPDHLLKALCNSCARMKYTGIVALSPYLKSQVQAALTDYICKDFIPKHTGDNANITIDRFLGSQCSTLTICLTYECEKGMSPRLTVQVVSSEDHRFFYAAAFSIVPLDSTETGVVRVHLLKALFDIISRTPRGEEVRDRGDGLVPVVFKMESGFAITNRFDLPSE